MQATGSRHRRRAAQIIATFTLATALPAAADSLPPAATGADAYRHVVHYGSMPGQCQ